MASTSGMHSSTAAAALLLLLAVVPAAVGDAGFVSSTCKQTTKPDACRSLLNGDSRSVNATTVQELAGIALDAAAANAKASAGAVHDLSDGKYAGTTEGDALKQCTAVYGNAVADLDDAREQLGAEQYNEASRLVAGAEGAGGACEKAFADRGVSFVVSDVDRRMTERCGVAGDLIDLLDTEPARV
ncbi:hypothetical protein ACP4OV_021874 [Aristida adscensionis]